MVTLAQLAEKETTSPDIEPKEFIFHLVLFKIALENLNVKYIYLIIGKVLEFDTLFTISNMFTCKERPLLRV